MKKELYETYVQVLKDRTSSGHGLYRTDRRCLRRRDRQTNFGKHS